MLDVGTGSLCVEIRTRAQVPPIVANNHSPNLSYDWNAVDTPEKYWSTQAAFILEGEAYAHRGRPSTRRKHARVGLR